MNTDRATTFIGLVVAGTSAFAVDFSKLAAFDHGELAKTVFAVSAALFGYFTNKKGPVA